MVFRKAGCVGLTVLLALAGGQEAGAFTLLGAYGNTIFDVDPQTGQASNPRTTGIEFDSWSGIAISPVGVLYGLTSAEHVYTLDPQTGEATYVNGYPWAFGEGDIAFDPVTGVMYVVGSGSALVKYDVSTGIVTPVGQVTAFQDPSGIAFDSLGNLYVLDVGVERLFQLDKTNANVLGSVLLSAALGEKAGMAFHPVTNSLLVGDGGTGGTDSIYTLDVDTGTLTLLGPTGLSGVAGLTVIPEPATLGLLLPLSTLVIANHRRQRP